MLRNSRTFVAVAGLWTLSGCATGTRLVQPGLDERAAIRDLRALHASEEAYRSANFGLYDVPDCLATPGKCIPWYEGRRPVPPPPSPALVARRHGYVWRFIPGRAPERTKLPEDASRSSLFDWAFTAAPLRRDARAFCIDVSGRVCRYADRTALARRAARCPMPCDAVD